MVSPRGVRRLVGGRTAQALRNARRGSRSPSRCRARAPNRPRRNERHPPSGLTWGAAMPTRSPAGSGALAPPQNSAPAAAQLAGVARIGCAAAPARATLRPRMSCASGRGSLEHGVLQEPAAAEVSRCARSALTSLHVSGDPRQDSRVAFVVYVGRTGAGRGRGTRGKDQHALRVGERARTSPPGTRGRATASAPGAAARGKGAAITPILQARSALAHHLQDAKETSGT